MTLGARTIGVAAGCLLYSGAGWASFSFRPIPAGNAVDVSSNGRVVLSELGIWTAERGYEPLPPIPPGAQWRRGLRISGDGTTIAGDINWGTHSQPAVWRYSNGAFIEERLGQPLGFQNTAWAVNHDGSVVAGRLNTRGFEYRDGRLIDHPEVNSIFAVSGNGDIMVGRTSAWAIHRFVRGQGWTHLPRPQPGSGWYIEDMTPDGLMFVGSMITSIGNNIPYRWTVARGFEYIEGGPGLVGITALGVSDDGSVIVGLAGWGTAVDRAAVWTEGTGWRRLSDILRGGGVDLTGWTLDWANSVSADGRTVVGYGRLNGVQQGFVATIPAPATGAALLLGLRAWRRRRCAA